MQKFYSLVIILFISLNIHSQATDFLTGLNEPRDMLIDGSILYIAETNASRIIKVDLSDPNPVPEVVVSGIPAVVGLALNGTELYFSQLNGYNKVSKIDLSDPNPTPVVVVENIFSAQDIIFYGNDLYIALSRNARIVKIDTSIPNPPIVEVLTGFNGPFAFELVADDLYIVAWGDNKVSKIDLTNPNPVVIDLIRNLSLPVGLVHRGNELYIAEAGQRIGYDRISKIDLTSSNPIRETVVTGLYNPTKGLVIYDDVLYIAEDFKITSFELPPLLATDDFDVVNISVHPIPTFDYVNVSGLTDSVNYKIYSVSGTILEKGIVAENGIINVQSLTSGIYFLVLEDRQVKRIVKL